MKTLFGEAISIGFTGSSKEDMTSKQAVKLKSFLHRAQVKADDAKVEFHHGECIHCDHQAGVLALKEGLWVVGHPPINESKRAKCLVHERRLPKEYKARDIDIVEETQLLLATPKEFVEVVRSGTWMTIRLARKKERPIIIIRPDGSCVYENGSKTFLRR